MKTTLRMPPELEQRLALWAQRLGVSRHALVLQALGTQLDSLEAAALPGDNNEPHAPQQGA